MLTLLVTLDNVRFVELNILPPVGEHYSAENQNDEVSSDNVGGSSLVKNLSKL